ncbi:MAG: hypothetical protein ACRCXC_12605 [Legionella sp.]
MNHLNDLREYISALRALNEVQEINVEVDPYLEIGGIIRHSYDLRAPAPLFNTINGSRHGIRILGAPVAARNKPKMLMSRVAVSLGLDPKTTDQEIVKVLADLPKCKSIQPTIVASGHCKENIFVGDAVDLNHIPAPQLNSHDGGAYISTL